MVLLNVMLGTFWIEQSQDLLPATLQALPTQLMFLPTFHWTFALPLALTLLAWSRDRAQGRRADWLHHAGVMVLLAWLVERFVMYA